MKARNRRTRSWIDVACLHILILAGFQTECLIPDYHASGRCRLPLQSRLSTLYSHTRENVLSKIELAAELDSLTVKELRDVLKSSSLNQRGILSRLKLKKDLLDYLKSNLDPSELTHKTSGTPKNKNTTCSEVVKEETKQISRTKGRPLSAALSMPTKSSTTEETIQSPKDMLFAKIFSQYPPTKMENYTATDEDDVRQTYHPIFSNSNKGSSDMDIIFVGTASCTPSITRGVSCTALRLNWKRRPFQGVPSNSHNDQYNLEFAGGTWLFDCGECTQLQVQRTPSVKPSKITKIFLTHAHGDHSFGLPGLLCLMGQDRNRETSPPVDIYGPEGLRMWLRVAIRYSVSRIVPNYRVHELKDIPMAPEWGFSQRANRYFYSGRKREKLHDSSWGYQGLAGEDPQSWISKADKMNLEPSKLYGEIEGGKDIFPIYDHPASNDGAPIWEVEDEGDVKVYAAPMSHGIPCVGYVVEEQSKPGRLRSEIVKPIVQRNLDSLKKAGFSIPMKAMAVIKNLPVGSAFTFPDGTVITQGEAVDPPRKGRKVVICGDTASSRAIEGLAKDADVVIHEATNSYLPGIDKDTDLKSVTRDTIVHGHSTPFMAGEFAKKVNAKRLVMNHFSARYRGDPNLESLSIMMRIENQAQKASGMKLEDVAAAWDFMILPITADE